MTIRVGMVGAGFIARFHAMQLGLADDANQIVAVHDTDRRRAEEFCAEHGGTAHDRLDTLLDAVDAVFVCTWTSSHRSDVARVVAAGLPVFCEKPLSTDLAGAADLVDTVGRRRVVNAVGLVLRSTPAMLAARELIRDPSSGRVMNVVFRDDQYLPTQGMYDSTWRSDARRAGSGALLEHSIHDVDILEWLLGEVVSVAAQQSFFHGLDGIEDSVSVLMRFASGATGTLSSVWHDVLSRPSQRRIEVFKERALVTIGGEFFGPVRVEDDHGEVVLADSDLVEWLVERDVELVSAEQRFLAAVRTSLGGGTAPRLDPDLLDGLRAHVVVDAIYRSARDGGTTVPVPSPDR